ncbi:hypothetical protein HMPREF9429_00401 [Megasphaera micronuciformis F0359]|uniref:Uncharacterized protein n=1 Tax=Megasphaera micronuciformis F0359 TaxID=706434 RepID=E2ZAE5_9FIRM|nr:hypothetical protein HMPREF9429_00401 [Megasphaera micronuciformis F0359]
MILSLKKKVIKTKKKIPTARFINFRPERPLEVALNILYGTDEIEYVVERVERGDVNDHPGESNVCDCHRHSGVITD